MGMSSEELKIYVPACGDRIAVINFCRRHSSSTRCASRTMSLFEKLKRGQKLLSEDGEHKDTTSGGSSRRHSGLGRKPQSTRKIYLGWIFNGTPVRQKKGGGSRELSISKSAKKADILKIAKDLFFPKGKSAHGRLENYECDILDFQHSKLDENLTVGEIYSITKINTLRFYLSTTDKKVQKVKPKKCRYNLQSDEESSDNDISQFLIKKDSFEETVVKNINNEGITYLENFDFLESQTDQSLSTLNFFGEESDKVETTVHDEMESSLALFEQDLPNREIIDLVSEDTNISSPAVQDIRLLKLHRGRVFEELLEVFQEENAHSTDRLQIVMILPNGESEKADDQGGVYRDALTEFWSEFYEKCTIGTTMKVPYLRHDFGERQWKAVASILMKGFLDENYFPIKLAPVFIENSLGITIDDKSLMDNFKKFVAESEAEVIDKALNNFDESNEDIIDFFTTYESKWLPKADNVHKLLRDIAHKELIQKPAFVGKCFSQEFQRNHQGLDILKVRDLYDKLKPSAKNCLNQIILDDEDVNSSKTEHFGYLKKFIKDCDDRLRSLFFRFCTGSDLPIKQIKVSFDTTSPSEFKRSPVAHTCSGVLMLPLTYESYVDFRTDFNNVLTSNIWIMDIL